MGRWSQRHRSGGGLSINFITGVTVDGTTDLVLTYLSDVFATSFTEADFRVTPSDETADAVAQESATQLRLTFVGDVTDDTALVYEGDTPGVLNPQTVTY